MYHCTVFRPWCGRVYTMHTVHVFVCSCVNVISQMFRPILIRSALMPDWAIRQYSDSFVVVCVVKISPMFRSLDKTLLKSNFLEAGCQPTQWCQSTEGKYLITVICTWLLLWARTPHTRRQANVIKITTIFKCLSSLFRLDVLALSVIATATWLAGWLSHSGIVSKPLNLSENLFDHLKVPSL